MNEPKLSSQQLSEQKRAADAWNQVERVPERLQDEYGTRARKLSAMIQVNGLAQTLAFLCSKPRKEGYKLVYKHLSDWVMAQMKANGSLLEWILSQDSGKYRRATAEALAYALWLRRFVEAKGWGETEEEKQ